MFLSGHARAAALAELRAAARAGDWPTMHKIRRRLEDERQLLEELRDVLAQHRAQPSQHSLRADGWLQRLVAEHDMRSKQPSKPAPSSGSPTTGSTSTPSEGRASLRLA